MPALQIKDCPADVYEQLRACAAEQNRSISQQTLTIIQEYLARYNSGEIAAAAFERGASGEQGRMVSVRPLYAERKDGGYLERRNKAFERLSKLPPIPISDRSPRADILLAQVREEDAR